MINKKINSQPSGTPVKETNARAALARVLGSKEFSRTKRVGQFFKFIVEETLAGKGDQLKEFTIANEVYGHDETFDPRTHTIVRVEAGRLRKRLTAYYEAEGRDDTVVIELPKGGYTPHFYYNDSIALKVGDQEH